MAAAAPAGQAQTLLDVTIQNPSFNDFEDGPQDWTANPGGTPTRPAAASSWAWGAPGGWKPAPPSGTNAWATNLTGNYTTNDCGAILSPPIDLTGATSASISFKQWRHMEESTSATGSAFDGGMLFTTANAGQTFAVLAPAGGYTSKNLSLSSRTCLDGQPTGTRGLSGPAGTVIPAPTYTTISADLAGALGGVVQVAIAFGSDGSIQRAGWVVDDFTVTIDGVSTTQDFEASNGGFTVVGTKTPPPVAKGWSHGVPTTGPGSATAMWATNPTGNYGPSECHWVESTPIDLGPLPAEAGAVATATLSWMQWFRSGSTSGAGVVQIGTSDGSYTIVAPSGGYPASPTSTVLDACLHHLGAGLGAFAGLIDAEGGPMTEFEADITEFLGQTVTLRFLFASTTSTTTYSGWYVDDVNVEVAITASAPRVDDLPVGGGADAPGWTSGGPKSTWAFGVTTTNPAGQTAYKTNLNGNHDASECSWIESPALPGALLASSPMLSFDHWHRIAGTSVNVPWAAGIVLVSGDGGATWTHVNMSDHQRPVYTATYNEVHDNCLVNFGSDNTKWAYGKDSATVAGNVDGWYTSSVDLSAFAGSPSVKVRFAYGSDGTFAYEGWAIRSVSLAGVDIL